MSSTTGHRIGFVGTRFSGNDGVSLEASKWAKMLWDYRHVSHWFAGKLNTDPDVSMLVPHAYFGHPDIRWINQRISAAWFVRIIELGLALAAVNLVWDGLPVLAMG